MAVGFFVDTHTAERFFFFFGKLGSLARESCRSWLHHYLLALSSLDRVLLRLTLETCMFISMHGWWKVEALDSFYLNSA